jgi:cell division protein FtsB
MDLKERIKVALGLNEEATEVNLAFEAKLVDGTIIVSEAEEMAVGAVLSILSEDGEQTPLPEGTYELEDGTKFSVDAEGVVTEIAEVEEEEEEEAPAEEEEVVEASAEDKEAALFEEVGMVVKELLEEVRNDIARLTSELDELRGENLAKDENIADLQEENTNLSAQVKELNEQPAAEAVNLSKFAEKKRVELSKEEYAKLTPQQKYLYNFNK